MPKRRDARPRTTGGACTRETREEGEKRKGQQHGNARRDGRRKGQHGKQGVKGERDG